jgi:hypothetical protein
MNDNRGSDSSTPPGMFLSICILYTNFTSVQFLQAAKLLMHDNHAASWRCTMRDSHDRRHPHATSLYSIDDDELEVTGINRRKNRDRRMENLTLEERQLLLSEMPSLPPKSD